MKNTNRCIALALCFSLTLGAFAYRPPKAEAVVSESVAIGGLLSAFCNGMGIIFSNNGMSSTELADAFSREWHKFNQSAENTASSFADWLGYDDLDSLMSAMAISNGKLVFAHAVARKLSDFVSWLKQYAGLNSENSSVVLDGSFLSLCLSAVSDKFYRGNFDTGDKYLGAVYSPGGIVYSSSALSSWDYPYSFIWSRSDFQMISLASPAEVGEFGILQSGVYLISAASSGTFAVFGVDADFKAQTTGSASAVKNIYKLCDYSPSLKLSSDDTKALLGQLSPDATDINFDDTASQPALKTGVDSSSVEETLEKILEKLEKNELATTFEGAGTDAGGDTDTGEDAKPYLPYIPRIFEKIGELPNLIAEKIGAFFTTLWNWLSNIITEIKALPAAIAQKISSAFSALWDWLSDIVTAIKAIPAAIAERVKALFVPHEGYAAEFVDSITATYQGRMGLLTYPFTVLADFVGTVATLEEQEPVLRWDTVEWQNKTIITAGEYNLRSAVSSTQMQTAYTIYKTVVSGVLVVAFLHLCYKKLKEVQQN